ncbi:MAG: hypothetical protein E7562_03685 [Ruminococcaceae bacterium]|nr:hypothetical protein [Oscillospiraceae bacterium]
MFKDDYTKEMEHIKLDEQLKAEIFSELNAGGENMERKKKQINSRNIWRIGFAACAALAIVLSVMFIPKSGGGSTVINTAVNTTASSYNEIFNMITKYQDENKYELYYRHSSDDMALIDFMDAGAPQEGATNSNTGSAASNTATLYSNKTEASSKEDFSETNIQVEGVEESDIVRTDGKYIYAMSNGKIGIISADKGNLETVSTINLQITDTEYCNDFYLTDDYIVAIAQSRNLYYYYSYNSEGKPEIADSYARIIIIDITNPAEPKKVTETKQSGAYTDSRLIGKHLYLISEHRIVNSVSDIENPQSYVPYVTQDNQSTTVPASCIRICETNNFNPIYTVVGGYDITNGNMLSVQSLLGGSSTVYCNQNNLLTTLAYYEDDGAYTVISCFGIKDGNVSYKTSGKVEGTLLNQFSMDEHKGNFRFVTTVQKLSTTYYENGDYSVTESAPTACLYVLDENLEQIGALENVSKNEKVYSVRFMGDIAYFVTFRQTDPLFSVDISDPTAPKILSALKIPGFSNYLFPYGDGKLLGLGMDANEKTGRTTFLKLSMFDISDPANVTENNKLILENAQYSPALYNHKASLIDSDKNLIGFFADGYSYPNASLNYMIFNFTDEGFNKLYEIPIKIKGNYENIRGLFIGDYFYLLTYNIVTGYSLEDFSVISDTTF